MLKQLKGILNSYSDEELDNMGLWINFSVEVSYILLNNNNIDLLTEDIEIKIGGNIEQEGYVN